MKNKFSKKPKRIDTLWALKRPSFKAFSGLENENDKLKLIKKISRKRKEKFIRLLLKILQKEENEKLRNETILSLGRLKESRAVPDLIILLLKNNDSILRQEIVSILSQMKPEREIVYSLEQVLLWDKDLKVRLKTIEALGRLNSFLSIFTLEQVFLKEENPEIQKMIVWHLPKIEEVEARDFLANQIINPHEEQVLKEMIWTLSRIGGKTEHFYNLLNNFQKLPAGVQKNLVWSLAQMKDENAQLELIKLLTNRHLSREIIWEIIQICGRFRIKKALRILLKILREGDRQSKKYAIWALTTLADKRIIPIIVKRFKKEKDPEIRYELKKALGYLTIFS